MVHFTHSHIQYSTTGIVTVYVYMGWMDVDKSISQSVLTIDTIIMLWLLFITEWVGGIARLNLWPPTARGELIK